MLGRVWCSGPLVELTPSKDSSGCCVEKRLEEEGRRESVVWRLLQTQRRKDSSARGPRQWGRVGEDLELHSEFTHSLYCVAKGLMGGAADYN